MFNTFVIELKNNVRLRLGLALIIAILWAYAILLLRDARDSTRDNYRNTSVKLARLNIMAQQSDWDERLNAAKTLQAELESKLWHGATIGLARASFQDFLSQQAQQSGIARHSIIMGTTDDDSRSQGTPTALTDDLWTVKAKLTFDFNPFTFNKLFLQLANYRSRVIVESLHLTKEPFPRVEAVLLAYFQKVDGQPGSDK